MSQSASTLLLAGMLTFAPVAPVMAATPAAGAAAPDKAPGQSWVDVAGALAKRATELEQKGSSGEAEAVREQVLHALVLAWREERAVEALEPIVLTLHRRLERSTAAVRVALRFLYEINEADTLSALQRAQITRLHEQLDLALRRLRREAKPGDAATCRGAVGLQPGVLVLEGPLPGDPLLVLRDTAGGGLRAVECPAVTAEGPAADPASAAPPAVAGVSHWWLTGSGIGLLAAGGVMLGFGVDAWQEASQLESELAGSGSDESHTAKERRLLERESGSKGLLVGGGVLIAAGATLLIAGLVSADAQEPSSPAQLSLSPGGAVFTLRFE